MDEKGIVEYALASFLGTLIAIVDYRTVRAALARVAADEKMWVDVEDTLKKNGRSTSSLLMEIYNPPRGGEKK